MCTPARTRKATPARKTAASKPAPRRKSRAAPPPELLSIDLALQGGGSHGAFTWGVLDALLEDGRIDIDGISGTSSGAMNAVALAQGFAEARRDGKSADEARVQARRSLRRLWDGVGVMGIFSAGVPIPGAQAFLNLFSQWFSPYQANPLGINPLRQLIQRDIDFDLLATHSDIQLFVSATNVRTGRGEVFTGEHLSVDVVMASACLPTAFKAVQIGDEHYWDGGYAGNPPIHPLIYRTDTSDVLLVQINPSVVPNLPADAMEIMDRVNEITFNAGLLAEMRSINFVHRLLEEGQFPPGKYKNVLLHHIDGGSVLAGFGAATKVRFDTAFVSGLFELGRAAGAQWLHQHFKDIGVRATVDMSLAPDQRVGRRPQAKPPKPARRTAAP